MKTFFDQLAIVFPAAFVVTAISLAPTSGDAIEVEGVLWSASIILGTTVAICVAAWIWLKVKPRPSE